MMVLLRRVVFLLLVCATGAQAQQASRTYVIAHGAWGGCWDWKTVDSLLTAQGHRVFRPSLTGLGERVHLASPNIGLDTHITDIVNLVLWDDMRDVILIGHSYGGMVITGAADRLGDRVAQLIYVDAMVSDSGESAGMLMGSRLPALLNAQSNDGFVHPSWVRPDEPLPHDVPHPLKTLTDTLHLHSKQLMHRNVTYILTEDPVRRPDIFEPFAQRASARGWRVVRMPGDHVPNRTQPQKLLEFLQPVTPDVEKSPPAPNSLQQHQ